MNQSFKTFFLFWLKIGFISFGGPAGQIALMHKEVVERKKWIKESEFLHALNYCFLLPGPEAQQLAIYIGWLLFRVKGALVAGILFILPSFFVLVGLSFVYLRYGMIPAVDGFFYGLKASVVALVIEALIRLSKKSLHNNFLRLVALGAFLALGVFHLPFPWLLLSAALLGWFAPKIWPRFFPLSEPQQNLKPQTEKVLRRVASLTLIFILLWGGPIFLLQFLSDGVFLKALALFFTQLALVTFGGAYAVLPYMAEASVDHFGWLSASQMVTGLGLAESTPGPLIMVVTYVGFVAGYLKTIPSFMAGLQAALVSTYFTFLPGFFFILLGAPWVEGLKNKPYLNSILATIAAAVVGVVLNLAVFFGRVVIWPQENLWHPDWLALGVAGFSFYLLWRLRWPVPVVIMLAGIFGVLLKVK